MRKQTFKRQVGLRVCITAKLETDWPREESAGPRLDKKGLRIPVRKMPITAATGPMVSEKFHVKVQTIPSVSEGMPSSSFDINCFAKSALAREIPYLKEHLKPAVRALISCLLEECKLRSVTHEIPEDDYKEEWIPSQIDDQYLANTERHIKALADDFESSIRKRINPDRGKRGKTEFRRAADKVEGIEKLQIELCRLMNARERVSRAAVARNLHIGSPKNPTASLDHWLATRNIDWKTEVQRAKDKMSKLA
jgi:hypothetical protein